MNTKLSATLFVLCITIIACVICIAITRPANNAIENPSENVIFEIKDNTLSNIGLTLIIKNVTPNDYVYGSDYIVEKKFNDRWERVPDILDGHYAWTREPYELKGNSITELEIGWKVLYGELSSGEYRIVKNIMYIRSAGDYDQFDTSVEFTID
jgi:hypothetical protein